MMFDAANTLAPTAPSLPTSVGVAVFSGYLLDALKRFRAIPRVNYYSDRLNTGLRIVLSGIGTLGIAWKWSAAGTGHQLLITIPSWLAILAGLYHWALQFGQTQLTEIVLSQRQVAKAAIIQQAALKPLPEEPAAAPIVRVGS